MPHLLDVARIAYILNKEQDLGFEKEVIYAAANSPRYRKAEQYESGTPHEQSGERLASEILDSLPADAAFSEEEKTHDPDSHPRTSEAENGRRTAGMAALYQRQGVADVLCLSRRRANVTGVRRRKIWS